MPSSMLVRMSADRQYVGAAVKVALLCGLIGCGAAVADDEELPALEFLEYLGSWEESDEDWMLFNELNGKPLAAEQQEQSDPEPTGEEATESEHES